MLPFPRLIIYGNTAPAPPEVIKILSPSTSGNSAILVLYDNGDLYGIGGGTANNYLFGDGLLTTNKTEWTLIQQNVKDVFCRYNNAILTRSFDDRFYCCGRTSFMTGSSTTTVTTYTECTSFIQAGLTSTQIANIKDIQLSGNNIFILINTGYVYRSGFDNTGVLGSGSATSLSSLQLLTTGVERVRLAQSSTIILKTDGTLWCCGANSNGQLGVNSLTNVLSLTQVTNPGYTPIDIGVNATGTFVLYRNDSTLVTSVWSAGSQAVGNLGNGTTPANVQVFTQNPSTETFVNLLTGPGGNTGILLFNGTMLYGCGFNSIGRLGTGNNANGLALTLMSTGTDIKSISLVSFSDRGTAYISNSNKVKFAGAWPTTNTPTLTFTELDLPTL